jgi:uncharacterized Tic20 family protein
METHSPSSKDPGNIPPIPPSKADIPGSETIVDKDSRTWGMMAHLSGIVASILTGLLGGWIGPLIIWLVKKEDSAFVNDQGKEALNFQITLVIGYIIAYGITLVTCGLLFPVLFVPLILQIVFGIIASLKANNGEYYRYPMNIRMIS